MDATATQYNAKTSRQDHMINEVHRAFKRFLEEFHDSCHDFQPSASQSHHDSTLDTDSSMSEVLTSISNIDNDQSQRSQARISSSRRRRKLNDDELPKYAEEALLLLTNNRNTLFVDFKDIEVFDSDLADDITKEYYRFHPTICRALADYVREERIRKFEREVGELDNAALIISERERIKKDLDRGCIKNKMYLVGFYNFPNRENIRDLSSTKVGSLTRVSGQVVRTHSVHPELLVGCFRCKDCMSFVYVEQQFRYTEPQLCTNDNCANRTRWELFSDLSRFCDFQRFRIQETQNELPRGCIPRAFDVIVRGCDQVECIQPGDQCDFVGTLIAVPDVGQMMNGQLATVSSEMSSESGFTGLKSMGVKEMVYTVAFLANACIIDGQTKPCLNIQKEDEREQRSLHLDDFTDEEKLKISKMRDDNNLLDNMCQSLFSSIHGSDDIKRGIFLQLLGGVSKITPTGTKLRGDINICLVGDPSTAKSQFLKIVTDFAPFKAVYASGKASSASGLTAAVVRDTDGGFVIEAGALMLADRGICCIDEFDKMELKDQVAIHEAMEQQTISITKAGVSATLNARASILAAANPIGGCYDASRDLRSNVNFSLPIMSRFDLFFTLIDPKEESNDRAIAERILDLHRNYANSAEAKLDMIYSFDDIKLYLRFARKYCPKIPSGLEETFATEYQSIRHHSESSKTSWKVTVRQLESLVRLSEAIARAYCKQVVEKKFVEMAAKLIKQTIVYVGSKDIDLPEPEIVRVDEENMGGDVVSQGMYEGEVESQRLDPTQPEATTKKSVRIPISQYKEIGEILIRHCRLASESEDGPLKRSDLVDWYLHECVDQISSERDLVEKKELVDRIIDRLVKIDHKLIELKESGQIIDHSQQAQDLPEAHDRLVTINPHIDEDDFFDGL